jgi:hypothetical protein
VLFIFQRAEQEAEKLSPLKKRLPHHHLRIHVPVRKTTATIRTITPYSATPESGTADQGSGRAEGQSSRAKKRDNQM